MYLSTLHRQETDLAKDEPDHTVLLRLTCPPGIRMLQGESQPIVNGSHLDNRLLHHHPVCILNSKETLNTEGPMCLRPFKVVAKHSLSSSGTNPQSTSELVFPLFSEFSTFMTPLNSRFSRVPFSPQERCTSPGVSTVIGKKGNDNKKKITISHFSQEKAMRFLRIRKQEKQTNIGLFKSFCVDLDSDATSLVVTIFFQ